MKHSPAWFEWPAEFRWCVYRRFGFLTVKKKRVVLHCEGQRGASMMPYDILLSWTTGMSLKCAVMNLCCVCAWSVWSSGFWLSSVLLLWLQVITVSTLSTEGKERIRIAWTELLDVWHAHTHTHSSLMPLHVDLCMRSCLEDRSPVCKKMQNLNPALHHPTIHQWRNVGQKFSPPGIMLRIQEIPRLWRFITVPSLYELQTSADLKQHVSGVMLDILLNHKATLCLWGNVFTPRYWKTAASFSHFHPSDFLTLISHPADCWITWTRSF